MDSRLYKVWSTTGAEPGVLYLLSVLLFVINTKLNQQKDTPSVYTRSRLGFQNVHAYNYTNQQKIAFFLNEKKSIYFWVTAERWLRM